MGLPTIWQISPPVWDEFNTFPKIATRSKNVEFTAITQYEEMLQQR